MIFICLGFGAIGKKICTAGEKLALTEGLKVCPLEEFQVDRFEQMKHKVQTFPKSHLRKSASSVVHFFTADFADERRYFISKECTVGPVVLYLKQMDWCD